MSDTDVALSVPEFAAPRADLHGAAPPVPYFLVGTTKLAVMMVITVGIYQFYWFYMHWARLKTHGREDVWPIARTVFAGLFAYMLFDRMNDDADAEGRPTLFGPVPLTAMYVGGIVLLRLGASEWFTFALTTVSLVLAQRIVNGLPSVQALPTREKNTGFSVLNWVACSFFLLLVAMLVLADPVVPAP